MSSKWCDEMRRRRECLGSKVEVGVGVGVGVKFEGLRCTLYNILAWPDREYALSLHNIQPYVAKR
jgi:hypothetical protein